MKLHCPDCKALIDVQDVNINTNLAKCRNCNSIQKVTKLIGIANPNDLNPLKGSKIIKRYQTENEIEYMYPKKGIELSHIFQLLFMTFWLGGIAFWTFNVLQVMVLMALFSIPFWFVGGLVVISIINSINEVQSLTMNKSKLVLKKIRPLFPKSYELNLNEIQSIKIKPLKMDSIFGFINLSTYVKKGLTFSPGIDLPAIITVDKTQYFFETASDGDQEWIANTLRRLLESYKNTST